MTMELNEVRGAAAADAAAMTEELKSTRGAAAAEAAALHNLNTLANAEAAKLVKARPAIFWKQHVIQRHVTNPHAFSQMASFDVASNIWQARGQGDGCREVRRGA